MTVDSNAFFVSPTGKDTWSGRLAAPNSARTDGPLATLGAAQRKMQGSSIKKTYVRGGSYNVSSGISLGSADAGVTFEGYPGETAVVRGARTITGWSQDSTGLWSAPLSASSLPGGKLDAFYVSGVAMRQARYPNYDPANPIEGGWRYADTATSSMNKRTQIRFRSGDIPTGTSATNLKVHAWDYNGWHSYDAAVQSIDWTNRIITLKTAPGGTFNTGSRYFVYDTRRQIDQAGEFSYDAAAGRVYLRAPTSGFDPSRVVGGTAANVFSTYATRDISIRNLTVGDGSATGRAFSVNSSNNVTIAGNVVRNVGEGVHAMGTSTNMNVYGNQFAKIGAFGVRLDPSTSATKVSSNWFRDIGTREGDASGVSMAGSSNNLVSHNRFDNIAKFAVAGGSTTATKAAYNNIVEYNDIRNANLQAADGGAIMFTGVKGELSNSAIRYNDISGTSAAGTVIGWADKVDTSFFDPSQLTSFGVYLDDYASGYKIYGNSIHDNLGGVLVHGGRSNSITDNVFANNRGDAFVASEKVWLNLDMPAARNNTFSQNIVYMGSTANKAINLQGSRYMISPSSNLYGGSGASSSTAFHAWPSIMSSGSAGSLSNWKGAGMDGGSISGDPKFTNVSTGDFSLQSGSPAPSIGYTAVPLAQMGILSNSRTAATMAAPT